MLKELENIINVAGASEATDPDFLRVMNKLLAKFYYILASNGLLVDYRLPERDGEQAEEPGTGPETEPAEPGDEEEEDNGGDGTIDTGAGSVDR